MNQRYATRGQRSRYDNESYQDDEDDEEMVHPQNNYPPLGGTATGSRESLGLVGQ